MRTKTKPPLACARGSDKPRRAAVCYLACLLVIGLMTGLVACNSGPEPPEEAASRVVIPPPAVGALRWNNDPTLAFSPDGARLAYLVFQEDGSRQIHVRDMRSMETRPVPG